jgi:hypothetical protein
MAGYELPAVPSDVSALMPPASQGVEQRPERHAGRTGFRWGLRAFVVGGLAGAAWLLSGAAAHAADQVSAATATGGLSILSPTQHLEPLVRGLGNGVAERTVEPVVKHATGPGTAPARDVGAADRPSRTDPPRSGTATAMPSIGVAHQLTSVVVKPVSQLVTTADDVVRNTAESNTTRTGVTGIVLELTAPIRPTGGPVGTTRTTPVTRAVTAAPLIRTLSPVTDLLHPAVPVTVAPGRPTAVLPGPAAAPIRSATGTGPVRDTGAPVVIQLPAVDPAGGSVLAVTPWFNGGDLRTTDGNGLDMRRLADADRHTAATTARPDSVRPAPGSPDPVPVRAHLGAVSGIPASGPGSPSEGGCAATVPAAVVAGTVACHRLPIATDVEVRRYDAESPTVSPD